MNTHKKKDAQGNKLEEAIGKGINEAHTNKVIENRKRLIGVHVDVLVAEQFKKDCELLEMKQVDPLKIAIDSVAKRAKKIRNKLENLAK